MPHRALRAHEAAAQPQRPARADRRGASDLMTEPSSWLPVLRYLAAAAAGAVISALMQRRHKVSEVDSNDSSVHRADSNPLIRPFDCTVCRLRWRQPPHDLQPHRSSKEHRRNLALLKASGPSDSALSRASENVHCSYCDVWIRDAAAYSVHVAGKKHARNMAAASGTRSFAFFDRLEDDSGPPILYGDRGAAPSPSGAAAPAVSTAVGCGVITCDLEKPENAGSVCRLLSNFSSEGASLVHVHSPLMAEAEAKQRLLLRSGAMRLAARHCDSKLERCILPLADFVQRIGSWPRPIVAVETAEGAVDIHSFAFPELCDVLVGGETRGVHPSILSALRPGIDAIVFIPMPGFARSMNVAAATCAALYEHRRQHARRISG